MRAFLLSVQFLTRIPVNFHEAPKLSELRHATAFYPVVGLLVGSTAAGIYFLSSALFSGSVSVVLVLIFLALITGGLHGDGLADCADGFGASRERSRILEIMRDSHIGAFGALALILATLLKYTLLVSLERWAVVRCLVVAQTLCRWVAVPLAYVVPPARPDGLGSGFSRQVGRLEILVSTVLAVSIGAWLYRWQLGTIVAAPLVSVFLFGAYCRRRIGGVTGDCMGAAIEIAEVSIYLAVVALDRYGA